MIKTIKIFDYTVEAEEDVINEILENVDTTYNWFNFENNDIFYDNNCNEYIVQINHDKKYIQLI